MDGVMNYINDPHPRVRFACCNAIGQMSTDFAPVFEKKFHAKVIPGLLMLMQDSANTRVQAHSGATGQLLRGLPQEHPPPLPPRLHEQAGGGSHRQVP